MLNFRFKITVLTLVTKYQSHMGQWVGNQRGRSKEVFFPLEAITRLETMGLTSLQVPGRVQEERSWRGCGAVVIYSCYLQLG